MRFLVTAAVVLLEVAGVITLLLAWGAGFTEQPEAPYVLALGIAFMVAGAALSRHPASAVGPRKR